MQILIAVDQGPYSTQAVVEAARLARNAWPQVRLLAVTADRDGDPPPKAPWSLLREQRRRFLAAFTGEECPYPAEHLYRLDKPARGVWEEAAPQRRSPKDLRIRLRLGAPSREVLAECRDSGCDLLIVGCRDQPVCGWNEDPDLPAKVASEAPCSVLVVKGQPHIERMVCCLDHDQVSQASLELINQLVTLYQARLEIVGLTDKERLKAEVERKMGGILDYYIARQIQPWLELVDHSAFPAFLERQAREGLVALWMGKASIFSKVFSRARVRELVERSPSPVLILR
jgi:nucleotide-binding universal stress UspA family protein